MRYLILSLPGKPLAKSYVKAHTRKGKNGKVSHVAEHYDKRVHKGMEHALPHEHDLSHLSEADRDKFNRAHAEQHLAQFYHAHAHQKKVEHHKAHIANLEAQAATHEAAGRHTEATAARNKAYAHKQHLMRHEKELAHLNDTIAGIARLKESMVAGSGRLSGDADMMHNYYVGKMGAKFKEPKKILTTDVKNNKPLLNQEISPYALDALNRFIKNGTEPKGAKREALIAYGYLDNSGALTDKGKEYTKPIIEEKQNQEKKSKIQDKSAKTKQNNAESIITSVEMPKGYSAQIKDGRVIVSGNFTDKMHENLSEIGFKWDGMRGNNTKTWIAPLTSAKKLKDKFGQDNFADVNTINENTENSNLKQQRDYRKTFKPLTGNTYAIKEDLKSKFGAEWDGVFWKVPPEKYAEAQAFVDSKKTKKPEKPKLQSYYEADDPWYDEKYDMWRDSSGIEIMPPKTVYEKMKAKLGG